MLHSFCSRGGVWKLTKSPCKVRIFVAAPERRKGKGWCLPLLLCGSKPCFEGASEHATGPGLFRSLMLQQITSFACTESQLRCVWGLEHLSNHKCQILALHCANNANHIAPAMERLQNNQAAYYVLFPSAVSNGRGRK